MKNEDTYDIRKSVNVGQEAFAKGDFDRAISQYKATLVNEPNNTFLYLAIATAYGEKGENNEAIKYVWETLVLKPDELLAWGFLRRFYDLTKKQFNLSIELNNLNLQRVNRGLKPFVFNEKLKSDIAKYGLHPGSDPSTKSVRKEMNIYCKIVNFEMNNMIRMSRFFKNKLAFATYVILAFSSAFIIMGNIDIQSNLWFDHTIFDICFIAATVILAVTSITLSLTYSKSIIPMIILLVLSIGSTTGLVVYIFLYVKSSIGMFLLLTIGVFTPLSLIAALIIWIIVLTLIRVFISSGIHENERNCFSYARRIIKSTKNYKSLIRNNPDEVLLLFLLNFFIFSSSGVPKGEKGEAEFVKFTKELKKKEVNFHEFYQVFFLARTGLGNQMRISISRGVEAFLQELPKYKNFNSKLDGAYEKYFKLLESLS